MISNLFSFSCYENTGTGPRFYRHLQSVLRKMTQFANTQLAVRTFQLLVYVEG